MDNMDNMDVQLLKDPGVRPTDEIIAAGLGRANDAYVEFVRRLKTAGITLMDWRYYNDGKAWLTKGEFKWVSQRGTNKVKPIFWFSVWEGFFKVSFFFSENVLPELLSLPISHGAKEAITNATPMGKTMRFLPVIFDVKDTSQLDDVFKVAEFRKIKVK